MRALLTSIMFFLMVGGVLGGTPIYYYNGSSPQPVIGSYLEGQASVARAQADMVAAQALMVKNYGEAVASLAKATQTLEEARKIALENDIKRTSNYYEKKKLYEGYQSVHIAPPSTKEDLERRAKYPSTGIKLGTRIYWPSTFNRKEFEEERGEIEALLSSPVASDPSRVEDLTEGMRVDLRELIDDIKPREYLMARKFIDSLEAQMTTHRTDIAKR